MIVIVLFLIIWACIGFLSLEAEHHKLPNKIILSTMLAVYLVGVLYFTLLNRTMGTAMDYNLEMFWSYKDMMTTQGYFYFKEIILNIILFVPLGFLPTILFRKLDSVKVIVPLAFVFSLAIEVSQLIFRIGLFELDDLFNNTLGTLVGYGIFCALNSLLSERQDRVKVFVLGMLPFAAVNVFFIVIFFLKYYG